MFGSFSVLPVRERSTGVRTLQKCSGAPLWLTWLAEYVWDVLNCIPSLSLILIIFAASQSVGMYLNILRYILMLVSDDYLFLSLLAYF